MRLGILVLVFTLVIGSSKSFDLSSISDLWNNLKDMVEGYIRGNGTVTEEQEEFLEKLNSTTLDMENFRERLKEIRQLVRSKINSTANVDKKAVEDMIKKFSRHIRQQIRKTGDTVAEVNEKLNVTGNYYQGDIILTNAQLEELHPTDGSVSKRQAFVDGTVGRKWGIVYYTFDGALPAHTRTVSLLAIKFWQQNTCIDFQESYSQSRRIHVFQGQGCYSYVGSIGKVQELSLGIGCDSFGTAAHEFGHALGFFHEQSRYDRDNAIDVLSYNVQNGWLDQFDKETTRTNNNYNMPYDYGSIMQYAGTSASANGSPTMRAKTVQYQDTMGSDIVSFIDVSMMNTLYGCKDRCASSSTPCQNGGFPHPRDCTKCLCPAGFGGNYCNERPSGCGATLVASRTAQILTATVGERVYSPKDEFVFCNWMITAPNASDRIQATITRYTQSACTSGCVYGGLEMKWQLNPIQTGSRYCCSADTGETVTSQSNILPIIGFNRYGQESFTISYRIV